MQFIDPALSSTTGQVKVWHCEGTHNSSHKLGAAQAYSQPCRQVPQAVAERKQENFLLVARLLLEAGFLF